MKRIRTGKDFKLRWPLLVNGERTDLNGLDLEVILVSHSGKRRKVDHTSESDVLVVAVDGDSLKELGPYRVEVWMNRGKDEQTVADYCAAFCLVATTCEEDDAPDGSGLEIQETVELEGGNIEVGVTGKSAYQSWIDSGNEGTESDFVDWMRQPAVEAGAAATTAAGLANRAASSAEEAGRKASTAATSAESAASAATKAATDARSAAEQANTQLEEGKQILEDLKGYDDQLSATPSFEKQGTTNIVQI